LSARDREWYEQKGMLVAIFGNSVANDVKGIADCSCDGQDFEIALGKIAQCVEIKHLTIRVQKCVLGVVAHGRGPDNHSSRIATLPGDTTSRARVSTQCSQIDDGEAKLGVNTNKTASKEDDDCKTNFGLRVHGSVVIPEKLRISEKNSRAQAQI
jgi:hypothetical protein